MARREFPAKVKVAAWQHAKGRCDECGVKIAPGNGPEYDHAVPDALGGEPLLANCMVLCKPCHGLKTAGTDVPQIAKAKRREAKHIGARKARSSLSHPTLRRKLDGTVVPK